jgi:xylose isomerase
MNSTDLEDLFIAHIGGMDTFALGLMCAQKMIDDGKIDNFLADRYASFNSTEGLAFASGQMKLEELAHLGMQKEPEQMSGKQEMLNNLINQYLFSH